MDHPEMTDRLPSHPPASHLKDTFVGSIERLTDEEREALYHDFQPYIRRLIRKYGDTPDQQEDLQGEIYYQFRRLLDEYDPDRGVPLKAYLIRKLNCAVYVYARKQWRQKARETSLEARIDAGEGAGWVDRECNLDRDLLQKRVIEEIAVAVNLLTLRQRQVIIWRFYEFRSFEEIAQMLGVTPATARSLLRHGIHKLRHYFAQRGEP
jgi:RNA polymerase sigma factor (sigma-70 family)